MRWIAAVLLATTLGASLAVPTARAERPKEQGDDAGPPVDPTPPPTVPPPPAPAPAPTIIVAPTVAATGTVIVAPPPTPGPNPSGPVVITPQGIPIVIRNNAPDAAAIEHRLVTVDGMVLGACMGNCTFQVPPGTYVLESGETDELRAGRRKKIVVTGPTMVDVRPGSQSTRTTGLVLGITGPVLFFVGFIGTFIVFAERNSWNRLRVDRRRRLRRGRQAELHPVGALAHRGHRRHDHQLDHVRHVRHEDEDQRLRPLDGHCADGEPHDDRRRVHAQVLEPF